MASEAELIKEEHEKKLHELFYLFSNPLQSLDDFQSHLKDGAAIQFLRDNDIKKNASVVFKSLPGVSNYENLRREMTNAIQAELYGADERRKRSAEDSESANYLKAHKSHTSDYPSRLMPASQKEKPTKSGVTSIMSQIEVLEAETNRFLDTSINDLEILSLPEHYPTDVHNVSSLAELYYLTQTLPLIKLLPGSHKALMTENFELALLEGKIAVLYSRIEELKRQKKWSLRQPSRYYDPFLYSKKNKKTKQHHWDILLEEAKWMATDFNESGKFKKACCFELAQAVQDYWSYGKVMCIKRKPIVHLDERTEHQQSESNNIMKKEPTPSIVEPELKSQVPEIPDQDAGKPAEAEDVSMEEEEDEEEEEEEDEDDEDEEVEEEGEDDDEADEEEEVENIEEEPSIDISKLLERPRPEDEIIPPELPSYTPEEVPKRSPFKTHISLKDLKKIDQSIILNLPKFTAFDNESQPSFKPGENSIVPVSRMLHPFDDDDDWHKIVLKRTTPEQGQDGPPAFQKGLFGMQSHRRFNFLRPPKPPNIKNIRYRSPTIWLPQDDKHLIHYVAEYCFNWDLIAASLRPVSTMRSYESNIERRTPWQCFERYIQLNEKFQFSDMKGHHAYQAQQWLEHAHKAQLTTKRRISPLGVGAESIQRGHRRLRWASMFDAMRKAMRRRETSAAKASRRSTTSDFGPGAAGSKRTGDRTPTPAELSKLKFDRDKTIQEAYMNQQATRSRMMAAVKPEQRASKPGSIKRPTTPNGTPYTVEQIQQLLQLQKQRRMMQQKPFTAGPTGSSNGVGGAGGLSIGPGTGSAAQPAATSSLGVPGSVSNSAPGSVPGSVSGSLPGALSGPIPGSAAAGNQSSASAPVPGSGPLSAAKRPKGRIQFAPAQVSAIINSIQQKNPNLSKEQVTKLAASYLANLQQQQNRLDRPQLAVQQNVQARQMLLQRQKPKDDQQSLSKMHYEERKKLMMQGQLQPQFPPSSTTRRPSPGGRASPYAGQSRVTKDT